MGISNQPHLPITYYQLRITYYVLPITYYLLRITYYLLSITLLLLLVLLSYERVDPLLEEAHRVLLRGVRRPNQIKHQL
jgi:predicted CDP-diglyceride synthetase/phosphatidate cytidylyltransferase